MRGAMQFVVLFALMVTACGDDDDTSAEPNEVDGSISASGGADAAVVVSLDSGSSAISLDGAALQIEPRDAGPGTPSASEIVAVSMLENLTYSFGYPALEYWPNFLFADSSACTDEQFVARGLSAEAHRAMWPGNWTTWKEENGKISIEDPPKSGKRVQLKGRYLPLPKGTTLNDSYTFLSAGGTAAIGGDTLVFAQNTYRFFGDGVFVAGSIAGVNSSSVVAVKAPADQRGKYTIEGFLLTLNFDDGTTRRSSIVFSTQPPIDLIWLGHRGYISDSAL